MSGVVINERRSYRYRKRRIRDRETGMRLTKRLQGVDSYRKKRSNIDKLTTSSVLVNTRNTWSKWPPRSSTGNVVQPRDRVKCGGFYPSLSLRAFYGNRHNTFLMELKLQHVGKNRECRLMTECLKKEIKTFSLKLERVIVIKLPYFDVYAI